MKYHLYVTLLTVVSHAATAAAASPKLTTAANTFTHVESEVFHDLRDGQLNDFTLVQAALIINGVSKKTTADEYMTKLTSHAEKIGKELPKEESERARAIFDRMHKQILKGVYRASCSDLRQAVHVGDYNCVTATILYYWLCNQYDVRCHLLAAPSHVLAEVHCLRPTRVETTCATWFDLGPENHVNRYESLRVVNEVQFLAKLYYNRGVNQLDNRQFAEAIVSFQRSVELDSHDVAGKENVLAAYNNWALFESDSANFERAIQILQEGSGVDAKYKPFLANDLHIHQKWVISLCKKRLYGQAIGVLQRCNRRRPNIPLFSEGRLSVYRDWSNYAIQKGRLDEAIQVLQVARKDIGYHDQFPHYERAILKEGREILAKNASSRDVARWEAECNQGRSGNLEELQNSNLTTAAP